MTAPVPTGDPELDAYNAAQFAEWGRYVALGDITWKGGLAATLGHAVPVSVAEARGWVDLGLVADRNTKEGRDALRAAGHELPPEEPAKKAPAKSKEQDA